MRYILARIHRKRKRTLFDNFYWHLWFRYHSVFFGSLIFSGHKLRAFNNLILLKKGLKEKEFSDPYKIFLVSMMMVTPNIYLLPLKLGGRSVGVPLPITESKKVTLGVRFVIKLLRDKSHTLSITALVDTMISSIYGKGPSIERKQMLYKTGTLNRHLLFKVFSPRGNAPIKTKKSGAFDRKSTSKGDTKSYN